MQRNDRRYDPRGRFATIEKRLDDLENINVMRGLGRAWTKQAKAIAFIIEHQEAFEKLIQENTK